MFKRVSFRLLKNLGILTEFDFNENYVCYNYTVKRYSNVLDSQKKIYVFIKWVLQMSKDFLML